MGIQPTRYNKTENVAIRRVGCREPAAIKPESPIIGDLFYETDIDILWVYDGAAWVQLVASGIWSTWTPTLTNITVGAGTLTTRWTRIGRTIHCVFTLNLNGSTIGSPAEFTLPVAPASYYHIDMTIGVVTLLDNGVAVYNGMPSFRGGSTVRFRVMTAGGAFVTQQDVSGTAPFSFGNGDFMSFVGTYEAAAS